MPPPNSSPSKWIQGIVVAVVLGYLVYRQVSSSGAPPASPQPTASPTASPSAPAPARANSPTASPSGAPRTGEDAILDAFKKGRSDLIVEVSAIVKKNLPDDDVGDRHQKFLVKLSGGHTLLVAHNIDLAPRAPVQEGDRVEIKGEYEWSEQGGVLHWTHHDPDQRHQDGHIRLHGKTYK